MASIKFNNASNGRQYVFVEFDEPKAVQEVLIVSLQLPFHSLNLNLSCLRCTKHERLSMVDLTLSEESLSQLKSAGDMAC